MILVTAPFPMPTIIFMLQCPILWCQSNKLTGSFFSPALKTTSVLLHLGAKCSCSRLSEIWLSSCTRHRQPKIRVSHPQHYCKGVVTHWYFGNQVLLLVMEHEAIAAEVWPPSLGE